MIKSLAMPLMAPVSLDICTDYVFWVLKRTVSLRRFFSVPTTYVLDEKIIFQYTLFSGGLLCAYPCFELETQF